LKTKARSSIAGHFGIPGKMSKAEIEKAIRWLLLGSKFSRGEVSAEVRQCVDHEIKTDRRNRKKKF
jgi:hypothetical protein